MKSQKKQLLILVVLFVFLLVSYITLQTYSEKEAEMETEENIFVITEFTADEVVSFSYDYEGMTYAYTLDGDAWLYDGNPELDMEENSILSILNVAGSLLGQQKVSEYEALDTYGLDSPSKTITITLSDGSQKTIKIGAYNEILGFYYLLVEGDEHLYLVDSTIYDTVEISYADLEVVVEESTEEITEESTE